MKINNTQLHLLLPIVQREAKKNPHPEWDALLNNLVEAAVKRGHQKLVRDLIPESRDPIHVTGFTHPLLSEDPRDM